MKRTFAAGLTALCVLPFLYILWKSISPDAYYRVYLASSEYLSRFWRSLGLCLAIATGQLTVSVLAGYGFARFRFPGKNAIFYALTLLMIMPLQVVLVPNYRMLDKMGLLNTWYALALPMIFVPLGTFIMTQSFKTLPKSILEAAQLDGCGILEIIWRIALPMSKSGLVCVGLLSFLDGWNMVEQPIVYLQSVADYPLSVGLALTGNLPITLACCVLAALPPLFLFSRFKIELVEGIAMGGEK